VSNPRVAVIPGDGIGPEVIDVTVPVLLAAARAHDVELDFLHLDWGSARFRRTGRAMPEDGPEIVAGCEAILFGAVGQPDISDDDLIWGLIIALRQSLDLAVNLRPVRTWPGVPTVLRSTEPVDLIIVRENTEGEYAGVGGRVHRRGAGEIGIEVAVHSRSAIERTARQAFELARQRRGRLALVTKSNAMRYGYTLWDEVVKDVSRDYPDVDVEVVLADAMAARMVQRPGGLDVLLCSNLFGDLLSDLAGGVVGSLGIAPSANILPGRRPGLFEPVHGSAPDIAGQGIANPVACLLSSALLLDHLDLAVAGDRIRSAVELTLHDPTTRTPDLGGSADTLTVGNTVLGAVQADA